MVRETFFIYYSHLLVVTDNVHSCRSGTDPGFFLGGGALVSCSTSIPINHIVFFWQNTSYIRKPQVISGGGAHPLHPLPRSAPAGSAFFKLYVESQHLTQTFQPGEHSLPSLSFFSDLLLFLTPAPLPARASIKPGTWNIPEHPGTSRNMKKFKKL